MKKIISQLLHIFFPTKCIFCGEFIADTKMRICSECIKSISFNKKYCHLCGDKIDTVYGAPFCPSCRELKKPYKRVFVPLIYKGSVRRAIINYKFKNRKSFAETFAVLIFAELKSFSFIPDIITYVPIHRWRLLRRGYNQTQIIAEILAKLLCVPCIPLLKKKHYTGKLAGLKITERRKRVKNSFVAAKRDDLAGKNVLLVDDIITTTSTITECCRILKKEFGCTPYVAAIASSQKNKD